MYKSNGHPNEAFEIYPEDQISTSKNNNEDKKETFVIEENTKKERATWSNGVEFLMSCISLSVGLGNIWRFPFTAYENGGGAFLIPYIVVLLIIGKPMYYFEMIMGQFTSKSSVKIWKSCPLFKGIGIGQLFGTVSVTTYYSALLALTLYYMGVSFQAVLPWANCNPSWKEYCIDSTPKANFTLTHNGTVQSSSELYFTNDVLNEKKDISDGIGDPSWQLTIALFAAWAVVFLVIAKGVKSSGKVAYFLALFPYVVMIALLIRAVTLDGAVDGIIYFLKPNWSELLNPKVWYSATTQLFFSLSVGMGSIIMYSSYNQFEHNIYRDALIVTTLDTFTSLLAGTTIFGILGNLAYNLNTTDISTVVRSGTGLAFISYPDAIAKFEFVPQLFAVLFFFMLFVLGIGSLVALHSTIVTAVCDQFHFKFWKAALVMSIMGFLAGLIYVTPGGQWMLNLVDYYGATFVVFALGIVEMMAVFWIYGLDNFCKDVEFMSKKPVSIYWRLCWAVLTPGLMLVIFIYSMVNFEPLKYGSSYYPQSAYTAGWTILIVAFLQFPIWGFFAMRKNWEGSFLETLKKTLKPDKSWGPNDPNIKAEWSKYKRDYFEEQQRIVDMNGHSSFKRKIYILFGKY